MWVGKNIKLYGTLYIPANKQALLQFWFTALTDCPENVQLVLANPQVRFRLGLVGFGWVWFGWVWVWFGWVCWVWLG